MISTLLFNSMAALLIIFVVLWFWVIKGKSTRVKTDEITILVKDGAYSPNRIETSHTKLTLHFIRQDAAPCAEYVLFEALEIHEQLPLDQSHTVVLDHLKPGRYRFTCQMGMYQGELIVR